VRDDRATRWLAAMVVWAAAGSAAAQDSGPRLRSLPASAMLGVERLRLPDNERMGLLGVSYVLELAPGWWVGPSMYGAATGQRGGLFAWGGEVQRRWRVGEHTGLVAGLFAGGGGGAAAPVGGGLMLRPHIDWMVDYGGWQLGLTASHVRFPSGKIRSNQLGLLLMVDDRYVFAAPGHAGRTVEHAGRGGIGADRMHPTVGVYGSRGDGSGRLGYVGLRLEQQATRELSATIEASGAASGGADGYMEVLAGLAMSWPVGHPQLQFGLRAAAGLAGGGAVKTGGGPIGKGAVTARWQVHPNVSLDLEAGRVTAFTGRFDAPYVQASVGMSLGDRRMRQAGWPTKQTLQDMEWGIGVLHYHDAARKDGSSRPMDLVTLQFNRALTPHLYLSGQAHAAAVGGAGAYAVGLVGLGATTRLGESPFRAGVEALVGAAGGGGVNIQGGAMAQPMAWLGWDLGTHSRLKVAAGYLKARHGPLATPVAQLSWSLQFGTP